MKTKDIWSALQTHEPQFREMIQQRGLKRDRWLTLILDIMMVSSSSS
jgi:uncharacterized membrane protein